MQLNSFAQKIFMNDSLYSYEFWRCNWVMLRKSLLIVANVLMNSEDAIESMLFHELSRDETSSYDILFSLI